MDVSLQAGLFQLSEDNRGDCGPELACVHLTNIYPAPNVKFWDTAVDNPEENSWLYNNEIHRVLRDWQMLTRNNNIRKGNFPRSEWLEEMRD